MNGGKFFNHAFRAAYAAEIGEVEQGIAFVRQGQTAGTNYDSIERRGNGFFQIT
jgi:hypothetical protein